jgi:hypothetical protein
MQIIVRSSKSELERRNTERAAETLRHYYGREIRDGARFRTKTLGTKEQIKRVLRESCEPSN